MAFAAPVCIGSKIYERTALKAESSFEEERVRRWLQNEAPQQLGRDMGIPNMERDTQTRLNEVHQTLDRLGVPMDSPLYKFTSEKVQTSNGYLGGAPNLSQPVNFTTAQPVGTGNGFPSDTVSVQNVPMRPATLHSGLPAILPSTHSYSFKNGIPHKDETGMERANQNEVLDDVTIVTKSVTDDIMAMFGESYSNENKAGANQSTVLDDVTVDTTSVTDDIMAMFSASSAAATLHSEAHASRPSAHKNLSETGRSNTNEIKLGTQSNGGFVERAGKSEVLDDVTINTKSVTDDIMAMFSGELARNNSGPRVPTPSVFHNSPSTSIPSDSESRTLNATADYQMTTPTLPQQPEQAPGASRGATVEGNKSVVSSHISQIHLHRTGTTTVQSREVVSARKDENRSSMSATDKFTPIQKHVESTAVRQWVTKETRSSILVESSKAEVGVAQDRRVSNGKSTINQDRLCDDGTVRSTSSRKRSSWSTSAKDTQCIYISDEEEKVDDRENKKQRVKFTGTTSNEGSGIMESGTPVLDRSGLTRVQQHPAQYSPALCSTSSKTNASPSGVVQR